MKLNPKQGIENSYFQVFIKYEKKNKKPKKKRKGKIIHTILKYIRRSLNKFPDIFRMGTFTDSTHMEL